MTFFPLDIRTSSTRVLFKIFVSFMLPHQHSFHSAPSLQWHSALDLGMGMVLCCLSIIIHKDYPVHCSMQVLSQPFLNSSSSTPHRGNVNIFRVTHKAQREDLHASRILLEGISWKKLAFLLDPRNLDIDVVFISSAGQFDRNPLCPIALP